MAADVDICNLAMQKLGAKRIAVLTEDSRNARSCNNCYASLRDAVMRANPWSFAITRTILAPSTTAPAFDFKYAFPLPSDCLKVIKPRDNDLDWTLERVNGVRSILTNASKGSAVLPATGVTSPNLALRYIQRVTDPNQFDPIFIQALASMIAWETCEEITQSNTKKADQLNNYKYWIGEASKANAFEKVPVDPPEDTWITAQL
jgi:hypothetical protein